MTRGGPGARQPRAGVLTPARAAALHPAPRPWTPQAGHEWRRLLTCRVEASLRELWDGALGPQAATGHGGVPGGAGEADDGVPGTATPGVLGPGLALAAVGSLARREIGPASDLDLVLLVDPRRHGPEGAALADRLWYPVWDAGARLDHSVRTVQECRAVAGRDLPAALGMLDLRHLAGDAGLTGACAAALLADWRRATRKRLPELAEESAARTRAVGHLVGRLEPDLKEAHGGLRDAVLVRALAASSLTDRPHGAFDTALDTLLGVRDALALVAGRPTNRLVRPLQDEAAAAMGLADGDALLAVVYEAGAITASALEATMRSALRARRPARRPLTIVRAGRRSAPVLRAVDHGVAELGGEVVLAGATARDDPALPLRVALASVRTGLPIATVTRASLARCPVPSRPWSAEPARSTVDLLKEGAGSSTSRQGRQETTATMLDLLVALLGSGEALVPAWEDLDLAGLPSRWLPGWDAVRHRPQHNPVHEHTVDRHMVRTAALAGELYGQVESAHRPTPLPPALDRPDGQRRVLLLAALLHDVGKVRGIVGPAHAEAGARRLPALLDVLGVSDAEAREIIWLTRHHLLLAEAAERPPGHAETVARVHTVLGGGRRGRRRLALLRLLTQADARAAGPRAWTPVRADVVDRAASALARAL